MTQKQTTRSKLVIGALASGAAALVPALSPVRKLAGLAGFGLGLFRSRQPMTAGPARRQKRPATVRPPSRRVARRPAGPKKGGRHHG